MRILILRSRPNLKINLDAFALIRFEGDMSQYFYLFVAPKYTVALLEIDGKTKKNGIPMVLHGYGVDLGAGLKFTQNFSAEVKYGANKLKTQPLGLSEHQESIAFNTF